jgi:hypothetical protein
LTTRDRCDGDDRLMARQRSEDSALARFYVHLVVATAVQFAALVPALAVGAVGVWLAALLLVTGLGLAAHGAATLAPRLARRRP